MQLELNRLGNYVPAGRAQAHCYIMSCARPAAACCRCLPPPAPAAWATQNAAVLACNTCGHCLRRPHPTLTLSLLPLVLPALNLPSAAAPPADDVFRLNQGLVYGKKFELVICDEAHRLKVRRLCFGMAASLCNLIVLHRPP